MSEYTGFPADTVPFLSELSANNTKKWFDDNRSRYDDVYAQAAKDFVAAIAEPLAELSDDVQAIPKVNQSIFRVNRDTRFSKDKTPYKDHVDLMFWVGEGRSRDCAAYFFRLTPELLHLGAGKHGFTKAELELFRDAVAGDPGSELADILGALDGYEVGGDQYKRVPKGFDDDHPRADLLRYKGLHAFWGGDHPAALTSPQVVDFCLEKFADFRPLLHWIRDHVVEPAKS